jgi:hypothetical protein
MDKKTAAPTELLPLFSPLKSFLELPMIIENNEQKAKEVFCRIQPGEIAYYYPGFYTGVIVVMKSGSSYLIDLTVDVFDAALTSYNEAVRNNPGKFGNLSIKPKTKIHAAN